MTASSPSVLVVGAGPSGLVLALALVQNGISVRIIDKEPKSRLGERGAGIIPRTLEAYNLLGVLPDIQKHGNKPPLMRRYELPGGIKPLKTWSMIAVEEQTPAIPFPNYVALGQDLAEEILRSHLEKYDVRVELGTALRTFEQNADHVVAHLEKIDGDKEVSETCQFNWLIGTDGAKGVVRKQLGLSFLGETREEQRFVVGDIYVSGLSKDYWHLWGDASSTTMSLRPSMRNDEYFVLFLGGGGIDTAKLASDREELVKFLQHASGRTDLRYGEVVWASDYRPNVRMVDKFGEGRVFVAGDAAHVHSPTGGQGMNSSVQDSFNLAWKLALVEKGLAPATLLSTYTEERLPVIAEMLNKSTALLDKTFTNKKGDDSAWSRGRELTQLGVNYRWSSIVHDEQVPRYAKQNSRIDSYGAGNSEQVRAGDRAPDAPGLVNIKTNETTTLFQTFGVAHHTALIFASESEQAAPILDAVRRYPTGTVRSALIVPDAAAASGQADADLVLLDKEGYAHSGYVVAKETTTVIIVRPDGVVGAIVRGVEGVEKYFGGIFVV